MAIPKNQIKEFLIQSLDGMKPVSGGTELAGPCPICGERRPKFYIGPFDDSDNPIKYNCFICRAHGYVDQYFLDTCKISSNLDPAILKSNKGPGYTTRTISNDDRQYYLNYHIISQNPLSDMKLKYINQRLGTQLTYQDCAENKIVLNISDLLNTNGITYYSRPLEAMKQLDSYFIGFLTRSCSEINMRNLVFNNPDVNNTFHESMRAKYVNYKIFQNTAENDFYLLPCNVDLSRKIRVFIAEGPMDILGIKYNLIKSTDNCIYIAGRGKAYENAILWIIKTLATIDLEIHTFPDKDVSNSIIRNIILKFKETFPMYKFYIHNNQYANEKDYGVPEWRISDFMWEEKSNGNITG